MAGNHSRAWHNAKEAVAAAQRGLEEAVKYYGSDAGQAGRIDRARNALKTAQDNFDRIDRNDDEAYDW